MEGKRKEKEKEHVESRVRDAKGGPEGGRESLGAGDPAGPLGLQPTLSALRMQTDHSSSGAFVLIIMKKYVITK